MGRFKSHLLGYLAGAVFVASFLHGVAFLALERGVARSAVAGGFSQGLWVHDMEIMIITCTCSRQDRYDVLSLTLPLSYSLRFEL